MLAERTKLNSHIQQILDEHSDAWGIKISMVEIKHIDLNDTMVRALAKQAEAERERRAKVIHAEGELEASEKLSGAAKVLSSTPAAMQLRYLQTLSNIAEEKNSTIVFPLPIEFLSLIKKHLGE
jgi:regulator of protease activity HflC (stomatin/prohibitin superfamily)